MIVGLWLVHALVDMGRSMLRLVGPTENLVKMSLNTSMCDGLGLVFSSALFIFLHIVSLK